MYVDYWNEGRDVEMQNWGSINITRSEMGGACSSTGSIQQLEFRLINAKGIRTMKGHFV
jgi:hypothetical protein